MASMYTACLNQNSENLKTESRKADSLEINEILKQNTRENPDSIFCQFDSLNFQDKLGKGLAEIHFQITEIPLHSSAIKTDSIGKLIQVKHSIWLILKKDTILVPWFLSPNEYRNGFVLVDKIQNQRVLLKVKGLQKGQECWIGTNQIIKGRKGVTYFDWATFISNQTLWITDQNLKKNPIRSKPNDSSKTVNLDFKYPIFHTHEYKHPWIQVSTLLYKSDLSKGSSDTLSEPIGWYKWYCEDTIQVYFPTFYDFETFYLDTAKK